MRRHRLLVEALCLVAVPLLCAASWKQNGKPVPDSSWAKSDGEFGAQLVFTDKPDELFAAWEKPGPAVLISEATRAYRGGKPIVGVIFFAGCAHDERGTCNSTVHFTMTGPDGQSYGTPIDGELWVGKPSPGVGQMQLSFGNIGVVIEPHDKLGTYTVVADILDNVSKKKMKLERTFEAVELTNSK